MRLSLNSLKIKSVNYDDSRVLEIVNLYISTNTCVSANDNEKIYVWLIFTKRCMINFQKKKDVWLIFTKKRRMINKL